TSAMTRFPWLVTCTKVNPSHPRVLLSRIYKRTSLRLPIRDLGNDAFIWASNVHKGQSKSSSSASIEDL
ncbi:hypothetical protein AB4540_02305, partial [Vibrio breoganii]